ncbi:MAG TPA: hypothetical protein VKP30_15725, partial [Polyangiaceae bacterium]|nr:hypothetical protein [Polyangiaceae bacterium]
MRCDSFPPVFVATAACLAACLCACEANEYNTDAASDASTSLGGSTAAASNVRASGGRIASVTGSYRSSTGGNGARSTHADTVGGAGSKGGTIVTGGTSMMLGASTSTGASASTGALGGAQSTGGVATNGGANSTRGTGANNSVPTMGGASMITHTPSAGTSTRVTLSGGASSTTQADPAGGAGVTGGTSSSSGVPNAGGSHSTSTPPPPDPTEGTEFSPYFYTWGWGNSAYAFSGLQDLRAKTELKSVTLAFVLSNGQCVATTDIQDHLEDVNAFRNAGGHVKASFGGANGTYLENACADEQSLATAIRNFVTATNVTDLDFDVEQASAMDAIVNERRARALKQLQTDKGIAVSLTL